MEKHWRRNSNVTAASKYEERCGKSKSMMPKNKSKSAVRKKSDIVTTIRKSTTKGKQGCSLCCC